MANPLQPQFPSAQEPGTALPLDLPEMEMLLTKVEGKDDKPLKLSKSLSRALDLEQNGHGLPFKVVSEGRQDAMLPWSASRASSRRASSIATASSAQDQEVPKDYLILAIASCFCPVWPLNLIPLIFSIMLDFAHIPAGEGTQGATWSQTLHCRKAGKLGGLPSAGGCPEESS
ncbi:trafficking regulator of GLUT4 1 isoform X5 [Halichoerus grypus]